jgi:hypothetical protein
MLPRNGLASDRDVAYEWVGQGQGCSRGMSLGIDRDVA